MSSSHKSLSHAELPAAFDSAAPHYDLMVRLNPGYHRHLRSAARALAQRLPAVDRPWSPDGPEPVRIADLGCGSGASTRALLDVLGDAGAPTRQTSTRQPSTGQQSAVELVGLDASAGMLAEAESKHWPDGVRFVLGRAEDLQSSTSDWGMQKPQAGVFAAYLFRNVSDPDGVLAAVHDQLAPGGVLVAVDYSVAGSRQARWIWSLVCWLVVMPLSWITSSQTRLYHYLWRSVLDFDSVRQFTTRLQCAGFINIEVRTVPGWQHGILHTFRASKPAAPVGEDP